MKKPHKQYSKIGMIAYFLKGSFLLFALSIIFNLVAVATSVLVPRIIGFTVDSVLNTLPVSAENTFIASLLGGVDYVSTHFYIIPLAIVVLAAAGAIIKFFNMYLNSLAGEKLMYRMRNTLFTHIQRLPMNWHVEHRTGDIIQRCTSDTQTILTFISTQLMSLIRIVALIGLSLAFMFAMNVRLALVAAIFMPILFGYSLIFQFKAKKHFRRCDEEEGVLSTRAQENISAVRVVKAFGRERYECEKFDKQNEYYTGLWVHLEKFLAMFWTSSDFLAELQLLFIVVFGTVFAVNGSLSAGELITFISYNALLIGPVRELGRIISNMSKAGVSFDRIGEIINAEPEDYGEPTKPLSGDIRFDHVSFEYTKDTPILKDISFTVPKGSTLGIVGSTGSGKSTITYLLDRLYAPTSGDIYIGETNINDAPLVDLRSSIGLVLQDGYLYSGTLKDNIGMASNAIQEEIVRAAKVACIDESIMSFKSGYDTIIGEKGVTLSGGQRQRVSIARTLLKSAPILIFDDSLSAVDSDTDIAIRKNLAGEMGDTTVIIISHRITTVMNADNIIVLDDGKIAEQGTNAELLQQNGIYKRIYDRQMAIKEEAE